MAPDKASRPRNNAEASDPSRPGAGTRRQLTVAEYVDGVLSGDRTRLARAVTLIESSHPDDLDLAQQVLKELLPRIGRSIRIGVTGVPGAGKSTLIETLGLQLTASGHRLAVMAVDPTSSLSGGSILGDKTRMERLAADPRAFIRPSPTGGALGGVARKTRETILLFEAAGYDVILVETVGVGQNEVAVRSMVDFFLLVLVAGAGDELQGIKRGVFELADAVLVNKADGENAQAAAAACAEYERALGFLRPATRGWQTRAHRVSALTGEGIGQLWRVVETFRQRTQQSGVFQDRRRTQEREWLHALVRERLTAMFREHPTVRELLPQLEQAVVNGEMPATAAAHRLLAAFKQGTDSG